MLWRVARGMWSHEDRDEEQLVEDRRWCQYRGLAAMQKKHSAARAWSTEQRRDRRRRRGEADREAVSHGVIRRFETARDGTQGPMKCRAVPTAGKDVDLRWH